MEETQQEVASVQILQPHFVRKVVAETIATYLLVFVTCGAGAISAVDERRVSRLAASVAGGLIVTVMIYAVGHISGAHMNPAVTLAFAAVRHFPWYQVPFYSAAQLTGAISAGFTLRVLLEPIEHVGTTSPSGTHVQALVMEIVLTFSMMFITSAVATDTKAIGELAGIAVGSAVCITSILAGPISGGSMNPARSLGPALASGYYKGIWVYFVGPVTGTLLGARTYNLISDEGPSISTSTTPQVPIVEGMITRSKARKLHKELDKVIIYITNAIHELANLEEGTRVPLEANITILGPAPEFSSEQRSGDRHLKAAPAAY